MRKLGYGVVLGISTLAFYACGGIENNEITDDDPQIQESALGSGIEYDGCSGVEKTKLSAAKQYIFESIYPANPTYAKTLACVKEAVITPAYGRTVESVLKMLQTSGKTKIK